MNSQRSTPSTVGSSDAPTPTFVPVLWTEDEAAASLAVSRRTFQTLRTAPWMPPPIVLGPRLLRWSADELRAAVASMPRQTERVQPESLLRAKIERLKTTGTPA